MKHIKRKFWAIVNNQPDKCDRIIALQESVNELQAKIASGFDCPATRIARANGVIGFRHGKPVKRED